MAKVTKVQETAEYFTEAPSIFLEQLSKREIVYCSDLHIGSSSDARCRALHLVIEKLKAHPPELFVLGGDVFELYIGTRIYFRQKFAELVAALSSLQDLGTKVVVLEGNHEFHLKNTSWPFHVCECFKGTLRNGQTISMVHGDQIYSTVSYKIFRWLIKHKLTDLLLRLVPAKFLDFYAQHHGPISRGGQYKGSLNHIKIVNALLDHDPSSDIVVFGHFHQAYDFKAAGRRALSVKSWPQVPNLLLLDSSFGIQRVTW